MIAAFLFYLLKFAAALAAGAVAIKLTQIGLGYVSDRLWARYGARR